MTKGVFITFEGPEGVGKTTQIRRLDKALRETGHTVVLTREPGGTTAGEKLRSLLLSSEFDWSPVAEAMLMNAARDAHLRQVIAPALLRGDVVLCDRFALSTRAYQGGGGGVDDGFLATVENVVCTRAPDLTLVFNLSPERGLQRAAARGAADRFEAKPASYHNALRDRFLVLADAHGHPIIDAEGTEDEVSSRVLDEVRKSLPDLLNSPHD